MNFKKIISISFSALAIVGAITACSSDNVAGADEQTNTMAKQSSSSVESSSSLGKKTSEWDNVARKVTMELQSIFKESDNIPMYVLITGDGRHLRQLPAERRLAVDPGSASPYMGGMERIEPKK